MFTKEINNEIEDDKEVNNIQEKEITPIISFNPLNEPLDDFKEE